MDNRIEKIAKNVATKKFIASIWCSEFNKAKIEVLDLYVYNLAMGSGGYSLSTAISILKTFVSIILLWATNAVSKKLRGETLI